MPFQASSRLVSMTILEGESYKINEFPFFNEEDLTVPFDVMDLDLNETNFVSQSSDVALSWNIENLPGHISIVLIDEFTGQQDQLNNEHHYEFIKQPKGSFNANYDGPLSSYPIIGDARFSLQISYGAFDNAPVKVIPKDYALSPLYPNPFNPSATLRFDVPEVSRVELQVYDVTGKLVETLLDDKMTAGQHQYTWQPQEMATGTYFLRLITANQTFTQKVTYVK